MTTRSNAAKVPNAEGIIADINIGRFLNNEQNRNLSQVSKAFNQAFFNNLKFNLKCADAQELQKELQGMRKEPEPCKNTAKVIFNPEKGMQRAIMCAIMSVDQKLHVYVNTGDLETFLASESVKCFDKNYALELTLLYPTQQTPPSKPEQLYCHGDFHALALTCVDTKELEKMRQSKSLECRNGTRVWYNPEENMRYAIMCAIISVDQTLHLYVNQEHLTQFLSSESVKCFDSNYALELTLLYPVAQQDPPLRPEELRCAGGFRPLKVASARHGRLQNQEGVQVVRFTGNTYVDEGAFDFNESLMELWDVNTIEDIHFGAFRYCSALAQLGDLSALKTIGDCAFEYTRLAKLGDMPSLTTIGERAFQETPLTQLGDMKNLTTIGNSAFADTQLTQLRDMPLLTTIGDFAFLRTPLEKLGHMKNLTTIGYSAFAHTPLEKLGDLSALKTIGKMAFEDTRLTQLCTIPLLTTIGESAFEGCEQLEIVHLPKALKFVDKDAFLKCPLGHLTVQPGINFECRCANLTNMLRRTQQPIQVRVRDDYFHIRAEYD